MYRNVGVSMFLSLMLLGTATNLPFYQDALQSRSDVSSSGRECSRAYSRDIRETQDILKRSILSLKARHVSIIFATQKCCEAGAIEYNSIGLAKESTACD